jgi:DNA-binding GntR family transcriptional regulator
MTGAHASFSMGAFGLPGDLQARIDESRIELLGGKAGRICSEIERRLARGHYGFGEAISTNQLVEEFGASRAPVVTALNHLRSAGYLNIIPQVGCRVISPSETEIEDFFCLFGKVEGAMAGFAAQRHEAREIEALRFIAARIDELTVGSGQAEVDAIVDLVATFHEALRSLGRSPMEARRVGAYWRMSEFLVFNEGGRAGGGKQNAEANAERREIIEAIASRKADKASKLMEAYVSTRPFRSAA